MKPLASRCRSLVPWAALVVSCAARTVQHPAPQGPPSASGAPSAPSVAASEEPEAPPTNCDRLAAFSAASVREGIERATRLVDEAVAAGRDPLAEQRAPLARRLAEARAARAPEATLAELDAQLRALVERHRAAQRPRMREYRDGEAELDITRPYVTPSTWIGARAPHELGLGPAPSEDDPPPQAERTGPSGTCASAPHGAWGLVFDAARPSPDAEWSDPWNFSGRLRLAYLADGASAPLLARVEPQHEPVSGSEEWTEPPLRMPAPEALNCCVATGSSIAGPALFDFDGDGEPEVFLSASQSHEGTTHRWAGLFTARGGRVAPYERAPQGFAFDGLYDVNGDGRPDLLRRDEVAAGAGCGSGFSHSYWGPVFAAISLPDGAFDPQHAGARAFAARQCPADPTSLDSPDSVVCARLWGRPRAQLEAALRRAVAPWDCARENAGRPQRSRRADRRYDEFAAALSLALPFTLR